MNESKKGYSSNIIVAIACLIVLWGIIDTVKFWVPFIGAADIQSLVKAHDPYKMPAVKPEQQESGKAKSETGAEDPENDENFDRKP